MSKSSDKPNDHRKGDRNPDNSDAVKRHKINPNPPPAPKPEPKERPTPAPSEKIRENYTPPEKSDN